MIKQLEKMEETLVPLNSRIPKSVLRQFKVNASLEGRSMQEILWELIKNYNDKKAS